MESRFEKVRRKLYLRFLALLGFGSSQTEVHSTLQSSSRDVLLGLSAQYKLSLLAQPRYQDPRLLAHFEQQVFSQHGEDGIIQEIFRRIGTDQKTFIELGTGDGTENMTALSLLDGWRGWWVEGSADSVARIRQTFKNQLAGSQLSIAQSFISRENISETLRSLGAPTEVDLLSIDIDLNTYYVWETLAHIKARLVVIEYNGAFPVTIDWKAEYRPDKWWDGSLNMGASLLALERLGTRLGYNLVGCDLGGSNAFFVRADLCGDHFVGPFTAERHFEPGRHWMLHGYGIACGTSIFDRPAAPVK